MLGRKNKGKSSLLLRQLFRLMETVCGDLRQKKASLHTRAGLCDDHNSEYHLNMQIKRKML